MKKKKAVFNWSGGKDSALGLYKILEQGEYEVISLLTTINKESKRSSMHGIPLELLQLQADNIGIPLYPVDLVPKGDIGEYENAMQQAVSHFKAEGVNHFIFGDIFLHDVKSYREKQLSPYGINVIEPLWGKSSGEIMEEFLQSGLQTIIVTTTADKLGEQYIGRIINRELIKSFPPEIDICGENGEYHTFCYDGKIFTKPVPFSLGEKMQQSYPIRLDDGTEKVFTYWFANLQTAKK